MSTNGVNGHGPERKLVPGINVPMVAFFKDNEDVDVEATAKHTVRLAKAGMTALTCQGSNGEAVHLTAEERKQIISAARKALDDAGFTSLPLIAGCSAQSTRETISLCKDAKAAGADYALTLPPNYYKTSYARSDLLQFYKDLATDSPIPICIYNYPGAVAGIDLDSDAIIELAKHPNIVGCKLTCGNTGKLNRIAHSVKAATPKASNSGWMCMGGSADFTLQTLIAGGSGIITGLGNIAPKACVKVYDLYAEGKVEEAQKMQAIVARGDWGVIAGGISGTKSAMISHFGYGGYSRRPLPRPTKEEDARWKEALAEIVELENSLPDKF
ncbi:putative 4-hydroxy-2-oxoglutarate aldolase, mitochondrial [Cyphellophora attinorum]|uniref:Putative 4-hydroxy-2-oxoglutarate aldolase, mitochondrial n=1 Tax=Cyphellophora attinorum TaxID=1664694 RepID=A0A0N1HH34_9EURO|nr:putative 4-hydroxy-2-oxoglutarate aldolase, mitochondrial [Phialophora attinorum]KPI45182.1 putative 4-hydroxy-2-oxoglutarate aldolase, mitochondrial [Phialophora attinorum]